ncbi:MAG: radical SAM protein [Pyrinomonadaceae bacterium]|nr:radical SAM protein [Pyrinomonadaceae bacterium]
MRQVVNPPNPYDKYSSEFLGEPPKAKLEIYEETTTRSMISKSYNGPGKHRLTVNCYRGCIHACTYCFARRYHEFLGYGAGTDFETKIVAKVNAPEALRAELKKTREKIELLEFSFATDPYIPIEANYELTRKCLEVCLDFKIPTVIVTKSPLVTRDIELIKKLGAGVFFSIPFLNKESSKPFEQFTPIPDARFRAMKKVSDAGIETGLALAPVIPGYNESQIPGLLEKAKECGATRAFMSMLHIDSDSIEKYFVEKTRAHIPTKAEKIINTMKRERNGRLQHRTFAERNTGGTKQWKAATELFELHFSRLGFRKFERPRNEPPEETTATQGSLF